MTLTIKFKNVMSCYITSRVISFNAALSYKMLERFLSRDFQME